MKWLVTGAGGMLGRDMTRTLADAGEDVVALERATLDIIDRGAVEAALHATEPDVVVNCAGWTDVDGAEEHEDAALRVNGDGVGNLAAACRRARSRLVHLSTDYVFQGDAAAPYPEDAAPDPLNAYGRTKLAGERAILHHLPNAGYVVRTAWLYGAGGPNFAATMIRLERERDIVEVVDDQFGQPTWTTDVARQVLTLGLSSAPSGIYHATSSGHTSWHGFAAAIFRHLGADPHRVRVTTSSALQRRAPRPTYSVLGHERWDAVGLRPIRDWEEALADALPELRERSAAG